MKGKVTVDGVAYACEVTRNENTLSLKFNEHKTLPYPVIKYGKFELELEPTEEEIDCSNDCKTCLTPIC